MKPHGEELQGKMERLSNIRLERRNFTLSVPKRRYSGAYTELPFSLVLNQGV